jgi:UDP-glucose 4-epimerase
MKQILITGASGYIGQHLVRHLVTSDFKIRVAISCRKTELTFDPSVDVVIGDILDQNSLKKMCKGIDVIIHLACMPYSQCETDKDECFEVNVKGSKYLLNHALNEGVSKFIYFSTIHVYGSNFDREITEETHTTPSNNYSASKLQCEKISEDFSSEMQIFIFRLSNVYGIPLGDNGWNLVVNDLCFQAINNGVINLNTSGFQKRNFISVQDLINALSIILDEDNSFEKMNLFNLGGTENYSIIELANIIQETYSEQFNKAINIEYSYNNKVDTKNEKINEFSFNISKIRQFGYVPRSNLKSVIKDILISISQ